MTVPRDPWTNAGREFVEQLVTWPADAAPPSEAHRREIEHRVAAIEAEAANHPAGGERAPVRETVRSSTRHDPPAGQATERVSAERLQRAMKEAHGRRITTTETYAEAIARNYNRILDAEAAR
jgi:hypothetical protein